MRLPSGDQLGVLSAAGSLVSRTTRSEEHTSELQSRSDLVCRLLLEKKKKQTDDHRPELHPRGPRATGLLHLQCALTDSAEAPVPPDVEERALRPLTHLDEMSTREHC